jgi:O-antigen ligase
MNKKIWSHLGLGCLYLTVFTLPWQTKLILRSALSNYWEISLFVAVFLVYISLLFLIPSGLLNFNLWEKTGKWPKILLLSLVFFALISIFISGDCYLSLYRLLLLLTALVFYFIVQQLPILIRRRLLLIFLFSLGLQACIGLVQFVTQTSFASKYLGIAYHQAGNLGAIVIETTSGRWLRAYGASDHPNIFGGLMALATLTSAYLFFDERKLKIRAYFLGSYVLFFLATLVSFSRAAILALALGLVYIVIKNWCLRFYKFRPGIALFFLSALLVALFFSLYGNLILARTYTQNRLETISLDERQTYNQRAWKNFLSSPLLGVGLGDSTGLDYRRDLQKEQVKSVWDYQPAHNYWLLAATESGIFFLFALAGLWYLIYKKSRKHRLVGIFIVLFILTLFDHWLFSLPLAGLWLAFVFALI